MPQVDFKLPSDDPMTDADRAFGERIQDNAMMRRVRATRAAGVYPYYFEQEPVGTDETRVGGHRMLQLGSTNYLGLAQDPRIKAASIAAVERYGTSCTSSRLLTGSRPIHSQLETALARFLGKEAALVFTTGYLANIGTIPALAGRHDAIFFDSEVHACVIDGIQLSGAEAKRFKHNDMLDLEAKLAATDAPRKLIVVDSLYSLKGDLAPLPEIDALAERYGAWTFLDDAHGLGVVGPGGRGLAHHHGLEDRVQVIMGVFSKSLASTGGFIAGSEALIDDLRFNARSYLYGNAIAPAQAAAALAALEILEAEPDRASRAIANADEARARLRALGYRCGGAGTQMVPVLLGEDTLTFAVTRALAEQGVWVSPAVSPGVPRGQALLRTCYPPTMTREQRERAYQAFAAVAHLLPAIRGALG